MRKCQKVLIEIDNDIILYFSLEKKKKKIEINIYREIVRMYDILYIYIYIYIYIYMCVCVCVCVYIYICVCVCVCVCVYVQCREKIKIFQTDSCMRRPVESYPMAECVKDFEHIYIYVRNLLMSTFFPQKKSTNCF